MIDFSKTTIRMPREKMRQFRHAALSLNVGTGRLFEALAEEIIRHIEAPQSHTITRIVKRAQELHRE